MEENLNFSLRPYKSKSFSNVVTWNIFGLQVFYYCKGAHNKMSDPIGLQMNRQPAKLVWRTKLVWQKNVFFFACGVQKNISFSLFFRLRRSLKFFKKPKNFRLRRFLTKKSQYNMNLPFGRHSTATLLIPFAAEAQLIFHKFGWFCHRSLALENKTDWVVWDFVVPGTRSHSTLQVVSSRLHRSKSANEICSTNASGRANVHRRQKILEN